MLSRRSLWVRMSAVVALVPGLCLVSVPTESTADDKGDAGSAVSATVRSDFDGDGFSDLVTGDDNEVLVAYGSRDGLTPSRTQLLPDTVFGEPPPPEHDGPGWPATLVVGDFDGDGYADLAVGVELSGAKESGAVYIVHGSPTGLELRPRQAWTQDSRGVPGRAEQHEGFGRGMAAANFGGSDHTDLAVGTEADGTVLILLGSPAGLTADGNQLWRAGSPGMPRQQGGTFGHVLAAGHFWGGPYADLAIGSPDAKVGGQSYAGSVTVLRGSSAGLTTRGSQFWTQNSAGITGGAERGDWFGEQLVSGRFTGQNHDDLAIGAPGEDLAGKPATGAVHVLYGSATGLRAKGSQFWSKKGAMPGKLGRNDLFGRALATGNLGRDRDGRSYGDLVIGSPGDGSWSGSVHVLYGSAGGLSVGQVERISQDSHGIAGARESGDQFGAPLAIGDFGNNSGQRRYDDVAIAAEWEDTTSAGWGTVSFIYGSAGGLTADGNQIWNRRRLRIDFWAGFALTAR